MDVIYAIIMIAIGLFVVIIGISSGAHIGINLPPTTPRPPRPFGQGKRHES